MHDDDFFPRESQLSADLSSYSHPHQPMPPFPHSSAQLILPTSPSQPPIQSDHNHPSSLALPYDFTQPSSLPPSARASIYRHHRHPSNASEASSSSPFPEHSSHDPSAHLSASPAPSFEEPSTSFVDEPLPMEGEFATMDIHSPPSLLNSFLPRPPSSANSTAQPFRYNTLTWAKEHPYPEPQDTILATGGLRPKTSVSNLTAMLESAQHSSGSPRSSSFHQISPDRTSCQNSLDQSLCGAPHSESSGSHTASIHLPGVICNNPQIPTITTTSMSSNPTSPLLRLNMNHPAMPNGPSISLTSATPLTAKPGQPLEKFLESMGSLHSRPSNEQINHSQTLAMSQSNDLFQPLVAQPPEGAMQPSHQMGATQQNSFLNARPVRARQRSKSESMGKQHSISTGTDAITKFFFGNATTCAPPASQFPSNTQWAPPSSTATSPYFNSPEPANFWPPFSSSQQTTLTSQAPQPTSQSSSNDGRSQLLQQFIDSSYLLGGLFQEFGHEEALDIPNYDSSFLKPSAHVNHRRSHSVSHVHRRGRSEGEIAPGRIEHGLMLDSFLSIPNGTSSMCNNPCYASSQGQSNSMAPVGQRQDLVPTDPSWPTSFPSDIILDTNYNNTIQQFTASQIHSPAPSDVCLSSQYSSRPRSFSHTSSFGSEEASGSGPPSTSLLPLELRSRTTAATKAAAVKRRKVGVAARYACDMCGETFTRRYNLRGHQRAHKGEKPFACGYPGCNSRFARAHDQKRHYKLHLGAKDYSCPICKKTFIRLDALQRHHKSDVGQACFKQLEQTGTQSLIEDAFLLGNPNTTEPSNQYSASSLSFILPSFSNGNEEPKPCLQLHSEHAFVPGPVVENSNSMTGARNNDCSQENFFQV